MIIGDVMDYRPILFGEQLQHITWHSVVHDSTESVWGNGVYDALVVGNIQCDGSGSQCNGVPQNHTGVRTGQINPESQDIGFYSSVWHDDDRGDVKACQDDLLDQPEYIDRRVVKPELRQVIHLIIIEGVVLEDRKSTRLNSSHVASSYAVFCFKKK